MAMNVVGRWKIKEVQMLDSDLNRTWRPVEDVLADDSIDDKALFMSKVMFTEDGRILMMLEKPADMSQEEVDEMVAEGEMELYDGYLVYEKHPWKEEDGKVLFDSGMKGEVFGEAVSPWIEIKGSDDEIFLFSYKLVRD
ncbi:MAG: hypothetical protein IKP18_00490 [Candidatus Methanomethylophilaceae archaeon]|nr:hypothetical protein [Candidatus Methanomethylophilaceae archaeon]